MIHLTLAGGPECLILCQRDLDKLRGGNQLITSGRTIMVTFTPDETRIGDKVNSELIRGTVSFERFDTIMREVYKETGDARSNRKQGQGGRPDDVAPESHDL
jgi:hypothetical protein